MLYKAISIHKAQFFFKKMKKDDYIEALQRLYITVTRAYEINPSIHFEVFIHKVDGLSDDYKIGLNTLEKKTL
jgi:hypothetical protein